MTFFRNLAKQLFGTSFETIDLKIAFHKEANVYGTHGVLRASNIELGLENANVRFVFVGMSTPPPMTPRIFQYLWEEAKAQGFLPQELTKYGNVLITDTSMTSKFLVSAEQKQKEVFHPTSTLEGSHKAVPALNVTALHDNLYHDSRYPR